MRVSRNKLGERVGNGNDGLAKHLALHAVGHPEGARTGHSSAFSAEGASQRMFQDFVRVLSFWGRSGGGSRLKISVAFGVVLSDAIYHAVAEGTPVDGTLILFGHYLRYALKWRP